MVRVGSSAARKLPTWGGEGEKRQGTHGQGAGRQRTRVMVRCVA